MLANIQSIAMWINLFGFYLGLVAIIVKTASGEKGQCHGSYYHRPKCVDYPDGYGCRCGPGYVWNFGYCVAIGLDSRFEFQRLTPLRYAVVLNKAFPELSAFTIAMWVKVTWSRSRNRSSTILSYTDKLGNQPIVKISLEPDLKLQLYKEEVRTSTRLNVSKWTHLVWSHDIAEGTWQLYLNGQQFSTGITQTGHSTVPSGGELVLGQSARPLEGLFDSKLAFLGHLAFVNIWSHVLTRGEVKAVYKDCTLQLCGDAVEWADFRSGTRGALRIRWPSFVYGRKSCFIDDDTACENYCSKVNGAKCSAETMANINWPRTVVRSSALVPCPGEGQDSGNFTANIATRICTAVQGNTWKWQSPDVTACTTEELLHLRSKIASAGVDNVFNASEVLRVAQNMTEEMSVSNPIDLSTIIDTLDIIIRKQGLNIENPESSKHSRATRTFTPEIDLRDYPAWEDTRHFTVQIAVLLESLVSSNNIDSWTLSQPSGNEGDHFLKVVDDFFITLAKSLEYHLKQGDITYNQQARLNLTSDLLKFSVRLYKKQGTSALTFPVADIKNTAILQPNISLPSNALFNPNETFPKYAILSTALFNISKVIPNHDIFRKSKADNVNSVIASVGIYNYNTQLPVPFEIYFPFHETFNISNPECVRLEHKTSTKPWRWSKEGCVLVPRSKAGVTCRCQQLGWYTVITDMYDINFKEIEIYHPLLEAPSYVGSILSAAMCLFSVIMLIYFKTTSKTAGIHKHFGTSVVLLQMTFIIGINRSEYTTLCHALAICLHYFFLSTFLWLMNEAFNLYILITYAAHAHGEQNEGGSDWRYYLLGWALPAVLVGAIAGSHKDTYYAEDMCWISWRHVWLFCGPAIGIISVTILVLIFTAKEHKESAYSKKEDTNNMIVLYAKAVWTQVILLTVSWTFAFLSIKMAGSIIEWIYAFLNIIQGAFFVVFYFWLNDEVHQQKVKQRTNSNKAGYTCSANASFEEHVELTMCEENQPVENTPGSSSNSNTTAPKFIRRDLNSKIIEEETDLSGNELSDDEVWERRVLTTTCV